MVLLTGIKVGMLESKNITVFHICITLPYLSTGQGGKCEYIYLFRAHLRQITIDTETGTVFNALSYDYDVGTGISLTGEVISYSLYTNKPLGLVPSGMGALIQYFL
jgi:hypothetical protein